MPRVEHLITVCPTDISYVAGIVDGEGTILWNKRTGTHPRLGGTLHIRATNVSEDLIDWLVRRCSGVKNEEWSYLDGRRRLDDRKEKWRWAASGYEAVIVAHALLPFLIVKREVALSGLAKWWETEPYRRPETLSKAAARMALAGWPVPDRR